MRLSQQTQARVRIAAKSEAPVLITGPTGSGKSSLSKLTHELSERKGKPFVTINLATLHEGTFEAELFGYEKGAFTGADQRRIGRLESAQGGTVFLDEIGELSPRLQTRLLEVLQSKIISPVGSNREIALDIRVIAATQKDLAQAISKGEFREDLFHRLRVIEIRLESLLERRDEFDEIVHESLNAICAKHDRSVLKISEQVAQKLENYNWPGNFRELRNVLEYAVLSSEASEIKERDLPDWFGESYLSVATLASSVNAALGIAEFPLTLDYQNSLTQFER